MTSSAASENSVSLATLEDFGDHWNPMVVREVRRMLKSRSFGVSYVLLTFACLAAALLMTFDHDFSVPTAEHGDVFCQVFLGLLTIPVMIVVPLSLFAAASQEHLDQTLEMLSVTTLKTEQLIWGFTWCGVLHAGVYFCALGPYICFGYLLGGVGLFQILAGFVCVAVMGLAAGIWGLMLGSCSKGPIARNFCGGLALMGGGILALMTTSINALFFSAVSGGMIEGLLCIAAVLIPACFLMFGVARQQLLLNDPFMKPYRVQLDNDGNVVRFVPRPDSMYDPYPPLAAPELIRNNGETKPKLEESKVTAE